MAQMITINIKKGDVVDAQLTGIALQTLADNITLENFEILVQKSKKAGMNERIRKFKNLI